MSECMVHQLAFGPLGPAAPGQHLHMLSDKNFDVVDFECPSCGMRLFLYYRYTPFGGGKDENQKKGDQK